MLYCVTLKSIIKKFCHHVQQRVVIIDIRLKVRNIFNKVTSIKDCPNKLAKSFALGFGLALLPLPGLNIAISVVLAKVLRLNVVAATLPGIMLTYVSPVLYVLNYKTGALLLKVQEAPPSQYAITYDLSFFAKAIDFFNNLGTAYLLGSFINASISALLSYLIFLSIYKGFNKAL